MVLYFMAMPVVKCVQSGIVADRWNKRGGQRSPEVRRASGKVPCGEARRETGKKRDIATLPVNVSA
jgi:hypothetical protein